MTPTEPTRDQGDGAGVVERPTWSALFGTAPDMEFLTEQQEMEHRLAQVTAERDEARAREAGLRARVERVEGLAEEWESWARRASTQRIDAFGDAARHLRAAQDGGACDSAHLPRHPPLDQPAALRQPDPRQRLRPGSEHAKALEEAREAVKAANLPRLTGARIALILRPADR